MKNAVFFRMLLAGFFIFSLWGSDSSLKAQPGNTECNEIASFSIQTGTCNPCLVTFIPTTNNVLLSVWTFGDGSPNEMGLTVVHSYQTSGTYLVKHTVVIPGPLGGITLTCTKSITVNCVSSVNEYLKDCVLHISLCGNTTPGCTNAWQVLNASGQPVPGLQSNDPNPDFRLDNINTYVNSHVTIRHIITCGNTVTTEMIDHTIQHEGIFVGGENLPNLPYDGASVLNNNQWVFGDLSITGKNIYVDAILRINTTSSGQTQTVTFGKDRVCLNSDAGIDVESGNSLLISLQSFLYNGGPKAWRGMRSLGGSHLDIRFGTTLKGAVYGVDYWGGNLKLLNCNFTNSFLALYLRNNFAQTDLSIGGVQFGSGILPPLGGTAVDAPILEESGGYSTARPFASIFAKNKPNSARLIITDNNAFNGAASGVYLVNTHADIQKCNFANHPQESTYLLDHTGNGVYFRATQPNRTLNLSSNSCAHSHFGYRVISAADGTMVTTTTPAQNTSFQNQFGLALEQEAGGRFAATEIRNNSFDLSYVAGILFKCNEPNANSEISIRSNTLMVNSNDGILLKGANQSDQINVWFNSITMDVNPEQNGKSGIHLQDFNKGNIQSNPITLPSFGGANDPLGYRGIWLQGSSGATISGNMINGQFGMNNIYEPPFSTGIRLESSPGNIVRENVISGAGTGMKFVGNCTSTNNIGCNKISGFGFGIWYETGAVTGAQTNQGNTWTNPVTSPDPVNLPYAGARHDGDVANFGQSIYKTLQGASTQYPQTFKLIDPTWINAWFKPGGSSNCPQFTGGEDRSPANEDLMVWQVYPNPADEWLTVQFPAQEASAQVTLRNCTGSIVGQRQASAGDEQAQLSTSHLPPGVYMLEVVSKDVVTHREKVMILHR